MQEENYMLYFVEYKTVVLEFTMCGITRDFGQKKVLDHTVHGQGEKKDHFLTCSCWFLHPILEKSWWNIFNDYIFEISGFH